VSAEYDGSQVVGLDLHRNRTVMVRMTPSGDVLESVRFANDAQALAEQIGKAGRSPEVVLEATNGWYWAVDVLLGVGASVHLAHPLGVKGFAYRRVKNDYRDAADLADLLRMGRLPEAWIATTQVRERRELVRHRHKLVQMRSSLKTQVHAVLAKRGVTVVDSDLFGVTGRKRLGSMALPDPFGVRVASLLRMIDALDIEIDQFDRLIRAELADDAGYRVIQQLPGVGPTFAAVFVAELGDVSRFAGAPQVCSWAGLTPRHRESDHTVHRGSITKQGSRLVRWAAVEAVQRAAASGPIRSTYERIVERRGGTAKNLAKVAAARKLLTLVYYGLRDGEIRCLAARTA
jgi:transposase